MEVLGYRPSTMALLKATFNYWTIARGYWKIVESWGGGKRCWNNYTSWNMTRTSHVAEHDLLNQACEMHATTGRVRRQWTRREKVKWIKAGYLTDYYWLPGFLSSK